MVKPLCFLTVGQVVMLRDVGLSSTKIQKQLNLKSSSSASYAYRFCLTNKFRSPKIEPKTPKIVKEIQKKLISDVLNDTKTSLDCIRVTHYAFSCYNTIFQRCNFFSPRVGVEGIELASIQSRSEFY